VSGEYPDRAADDARERAILAAARSTQPDDPPAVVRRRFLMAVGREDLFRFSETEPSVTISPMADGTVHITYVVRSAAAARRLLKSSPRGLPLAELVAPTLADPDSVRNRSRQPETIARALAIHYLSKQAGGRLTLTKAAARYQAARLPWRETWQTERRAWCARSNATSARYGFRRGRR
jgi:hypothetical protein